LFTRSSSVKKSSLPTHPCESPLLEPARPHQLTTAYEMPLQGICEMAST
jgi:hypothetical protein